jgi:hypothetical protein
MPGCVAICSVACSLPSFLCPLLSLILEGCRNPAIQPTVIVQNTAGLGAVSQSTNPAVHQPHFTAVQAPVHQSGIHSLPICYSITPSPPVPHSPSPSVHQYPSLHIPVHHLTSPTIRQSVSMPVHQPSTRPTRPAGHQFTNPAAHLSNSDIVKPSPHSTILQFRHQPSTSLSA